MTVQSVRGVVVQAVLFGPLLDAVPRNEPVRLVPLGGEFVECPKEQDEAGREFDRLAEFLRQFHVRILPKHLLHAVEVLPLGLPRLLDFPKQPGYEFFDSSSTARSR